MQAMVLQELCSLEDNPQPLDLKELPQPVPGENEVLVRVSTCGVCHTELDEIEGRTPPTQFPIVLGHQVVGTVVEAGDKVCHRRGIYYSLHHMTENPVTGVNFFVFRVLCLTDSFDL